MSTTTEKLGLVKPELSDPADITTTNENWDKIDETLTACYSPNNKPTVGDVGAFPACERVTSPEVDLNDYKTEGAYFFTSVTAETNHCPPNSVNGWLHVFAYGNAVKQLWYRHGTAGKTDSDTYLRTYGGTVGWGEWTKIFTSKDITYGTQDLTAGTSALETGKLYFVYE